MRGLFTADLDIHAWVNPYRISTDSTPQALSETNPYVIDNEIGEETENGIFLNPANKMARNLIIDGVTEIVRNTMLTEYNLTIIFIPRKTVILTIRNMPIMWEP